MAKIIRRYWKVYYKKESGILGTFGVIGTFGNIGTFGKFKLSKIQKCEVLSTPPNAMKKIKKIEKFERVVLENLVLKYNVINSETFKVICNEKFEHKQNFSFKS